MAVDYGLYESLRGFFGTNDAKSRAQMDMSAMMQMAQYQQAKTQREATSQQLLFEQMDALDTTAKAVEGTRQQDKEVINQILSEQKQNIYSNLGKYNNNMTRYLQYEGYRDLKNYQKNLVESEDYKRITQNSEYNKNITKLVNSGKSHLLSRTDFANWKNWSEGKSDVLTWRGQLNDGIEIPEDTYGTQLTGDQILNYGKNYNLVMQNFMLEYDADMTDFYGENPRFTESDLATYAQDRYGKPQGLQKPGKTTLSTISAQSPSAGYQYLMGAVNGGQPLSYLGPDGNPSTTIKLQSQQMDGNVYSLENLLKNEMNYNGDIKPRAQDNYQLVGGGIWGGQISDLINTGIFGDDYDPGSNQVVSQDIAGMYGEDGRLHTVGGDSGTLNFQGHFLAYEGEFINENGVREKTLMMTSTKDKNQQKLFELHGATFDEEGKLTNPGTQFKPVLVAQFHTDKSMEGWDWFDDSALYQTVNLESYGALIDKSMNIQKEAANFNLAQNSLAYNQDKNQVDYTNKYIKIQNNNLQNYMLSTNNTLTTKMNTLTYPDHMKAVTLAQVTLDTERANKQGQKFTPGDLINNLGQLQNNPETQALHQALLSGDELGYNKALSDYAVQSLGEKEAKKYMAQFHDLRARMSEVYKGM